MQFVKTASQLKTPPQDRALTRSDLMLIAARAVDIQKADNCNSAEALLAAAIEEFEADLAVKS